MPIWASSASIPLIILADRFSQDPNIQDFLLKFASITLTSVLSLKKPWELVNQSKANKNLILPPPPQDGSENTKPDDDHTKKIKRFNIVAIIRKICNLKLSDEFNDQIKELVLTTNRRHKLLYGTMSRGYVHLLEMWYPKGK